MSLTDARAIYLAEVGTLDIVHAASPHICR